MRRVHEPSAWRINIIQGMSTTVGGSMMTRWAFSVGMVVLISSHQVSAAEKASEELEARVFHSLAELTSLRDLVLKRYAMMVRGESQ